MIKLSRNLEVPEARMKKERQVGQGMSWRKEKEK